MATMPAFDADPESIDEAAIAYDAAGAAYIRNANSEAPASLDFAGRYGFADRDPPGIQQRPCPLIRSASAPAG